MLLTARARVRQGKRGIRESARRGGGAHLRRDAQQVGACMLRAQRERGLVGPVLDDVQRAARVQQARLRGGAAGTSVPNTATRAAGRRLRLRVYSFVCTGVCTGPTTHPPQQPPARAQSRSARRRRRPPTAPRSGGTSRGRPGRARAARTRVGARRSSSAACASKRARALHAPGMCVLKGGERPRTRTSSSVECVRPTMKRPWYTATLDTFKVRGGEGVCAPGLGVRSMHARGLTRDAQGAGGGR